MDKKAKNIVKVSFDPNNPPPMTEKQIKRLQALADMPDEEIDSDDIPYNPELNWQHPKSFPPTHKQSTVSLQIDDDILQYFQKSGKNWQGYLNQVLRRYMLQNAG